jgi:predicted SnoaL-like aldol condensation-catalyzing enzyme
MAEHRRGDRGRVGCRCATGPSTPRSVTNAGATGQEVGGGADALSEDGMVCPMTSTGVLKAMVAMLASGDPSDAAAVVAEDYLDHQGLGHGPIRGIEGFALVVRTNYAAHRHQEISIEDLFGVDDRAVARIRWRGQRRDGAVVDRDTIDIIRVADGRAVEHWGTRA